MSQIYHHSFDCSCFRAPLQWSCWGDNLLFVASSSPLADSSASTYSHDELTPAQVWVVEVALYYITSGFVGQAWTVWSWLQLGGFALLLLGTFIYNNVLRIPGLYYPTKEEQEKNNQK